MDRLAGGIWREEYPKPAHECSIIHSIIQKVNPDILALQEIGEIPYLYDLWRDLNITGIGNYRYSFWVQGEETEQRHLALLSRIPFHSKLAHLDLEFSYFGKKFRPRRGLMEVEFKTKGNTWRLFNLHLKSKWTERNDDPQAANLREKKPVLFGISSEKSIHLRPILSTWLLEILMILKVLPRSAGLKK